MKLTLSKPGQFRSALTTLWQLNLSVMLTSLIWSVSCIALLRTSSLFTRIVSLLIANGAVLVSAYLIVNRNRSGVTERWRSILTDKFNLKALTFTSLCLLLSLENIDRFQHGRRIMRLYVVAIFISMLIGWLFTSVLVVPFRIWSSMQFGKTSTLPMLLDYARKNRISIGIALGVLLLGWPIFFVYLFLALAFAQSLLVASFPNGETNSPALERESYRDAG
jgi:hypothetical protein